MQGGKEMNQSFLSEKEKKYNEFCGIMMTNIHILSSANSRICFREVDLKNEEHLFVLHVGHALAGAIEKDMCVEGGRWFLHRVNKKMGLKKRGGALVKRNSTLEESINPQRLINDLKPYAKQVFGDDFTFAEIYREFYRKEKRK